MDRSMVAALPSNVKFTLLDMLGPTEGAEVASGAGSDDAGTAATASPLAGTVSGTASATTAPATALPASDAALLSPAQLFALAGPFTGPRAASVLPSQRGVLVLDGLFGDAVIRRARVEAEALDRAGHGVLRPARIGHAAIHQANASSRGDRIAWITDAAAAAMNPTPLTAAASREAQPEPALGPSLAQVLSRLRAIHKQIAFRAPHLNLTPRFSVQLACYPGHGTRYVKHVDAQPPRDTATPIRRVTALVYLNPDWEPAHGGCLRAYTADDAGGDAPVPWDIDPKGDRVVLFRSDELEHEVLPSFATRYSLTMWMYGTVDSIASASGTEAPDNERGAVAGASASPPPPPPIAVVSTQPGTAVPGATVGATAGAQTSAGAGGGAPSAAATAAATTAAGIAGSRPRIFVSIPSYRDPECQLTIKDLFDRAAHPERIVVGVCWQYDHEKDTGCFEVAPPFPAQVRSIHVPATEARGPTWARHLAAQLHRPDEEDYYLQIDSHMRFAERWDTYLVDELTRCEALSSKPVLSTYPPGYARESDSPLPTVALPTVMRATKFGADGMPRYAGAQLAKERDDPIPSLFWAAGFSFSRASVVSEVPYDPGLPQLFFGEETSMAARMWTHGYDFFAPGRAVVFHHWSRSYRPTFRENTTEASEALGAASATKVRVMLGIQKVVDDDGATAAGAGGGKGVTNAAASKYYVDAAHGLGSARTLAQWEEHTGLRLRDQIVGERAHTLGLAPDEFVAPPAPSAAQAAVMQMLGVKLT